MNEDSQEYKSKAFTINNIKSFINHLKEVLDDMELKLNGDNEDDHVKAVISGSAMMECMSSYATKIQETIKQVEKWNAEKLN